MLIRIVAEPASWVVPYAERLAETLRSEHDAERVSSYDEIPRGTDVSIFLGCTRIAGPEVLARSRHNLVVHQSDLPRGRGWSPLAWQVIEGARRIPVCLFEAVPELDAGPVYLRDEIELEGHELVDELREKQARSAIDLCLRFLRASPPPEAREQEGEPTFYARRGPESCELDPHRTLAEQFDLLRICDNDRYPAFFDHRGHRYVLRIEKA